ncbi:MAG TPA: glycosyltransferase family 39 protein [Candidatus Peribacteraceae bacterium]|nr:glycosyltransferase family 39 protein [Candidatus Peribacteraceae bacterium]
MPSRTLRSIPEICIGALALFFFVRELGTFPAAWADDSLFMIVARQVAEGRGYMLPVLQHQWIYPPVLGVGPTLILPVALTIKLFGFSVVAARVPMVLFLFASTVAFYLLTKRTSGVNAARWSTLLLITLSAFVNTGKPVLGEIPGFFFLGLGFLFLARKQTIPLAIAAGFLFGLAILTKITYGLILPALFIAWIVAATRRDRKEFVHLMITGLVAIVPFALWLLWGEGRSPGGLLTEFKFMFSGAEAESLTPFSYIATHPAILMSIPFLSFVIIAVLGFVGFLQVRKKVPLRLSVTLWTLITLFLLYYLSSFGWYRHLLPAHLLLLLFVPLGTAALFRKKIGGLALIAIIAAQTYWQLDHRGASTNPHADTVAEYIETNFAERPLIVQQTEIFVRLPHRSYWYFLTNPTMSKRIPQEFVTLSPIQRCMPIVRKLGEEDQKEFFGRLLTLSGSYFLIDPPADCHST